MPKRPVEKPARKTRRRAAAPLVVRGEPVVQCVLGAALAEIARVGYRALRVEDVAARAGVNKTTVYRRWPTKMELVHAALASMTGELVPPFDTGSLRGDLLELGRRFVTIAASPQGQSLMLMLAAEGSEPEVVALKKSLRETHDLVPRAMIAAAVNRGELAADFDPTLLFEAFVGAVHHKLFARNEAVGEAFLARLADMLLFGALAPAARRRARRRVA